MLPALQQEACDIVNNINPVLGTVRFYRSDPALTTEETC
jgi:hypothetical protein